MISDSKIVDNIITAGIVDEMLNMVDSILILLKKFGKNIKSTIVLDKIKESSEEIYSSILFFDKLGKLNKKDLNKIKIGLKNKFAGYTKSFEISGSNESALNNASNILTSKLGKIDIYEHKTEDLGLSVAGEGSYFKRNLDADLNKLLA